MVHRLLLAGVGLVFGLATSCIYDYGGQRPVPAQPANTVVLNFTIDASGRPGYYADADLEWKGSFSFDSATAKLTHSLAWAGPYVPLYDDGPWTDGGHEPIGALAGDERFGAAVFMPSPTHDLTIEYGAQTKTGGWIWSFGVPNGTVLIPAGAHDPIDVPGLVLPEAGTTDVRMTLDTNVLAGGYALATPVTVRSTMSDWEADPAFDDGTHGDQVAGDGVFTYTLSANDRRRLLLPRGTYQEFVWWLGDQDYRSDDSTAAVTGAEVFTRAPTEPDFWQQGVTRNLEHLTATFWVP